MSAQMLYHLQQALPFRPFELFLADGRTMSVGNMEFFNTADDGQSFVLFTLPDTEEILDPALIVSAKFL